MVELVRRPWVLAATLSPLPVLIAVGGVLAEVGFAPVWAALIGEASLRLLLPLAVVTVLLGMLAWMTAGLPDLSAFQRRSMRFKRLALRSCAALTAVCFWFGVILLDVLWHTALRNVPGLGPAASLQSGFLTYAAAISGTAVFLYLLVRAKLTV